MPNKRTDLEEACAWLKVCKEQIEVLQKERDEYKNKLLKHLQEFRGVPTSCDVCGREKELRNCRSGCDD